MRIKPLHNYVLVELINEEEEKKTESGIILPDSAEKKKQSRGKVSAVGPGKINDKGELSPVSVKEEQIVIFKKPWSDENKIEEKEKELYLVEESDILATLE